MRALLLSVIVIAGCADYGSTVEVGEKVENRYDIICVSGGRQVLQAAGVTDLYWGGNFMRWKDGSHEYFSTADCIARRVL